MPVFMEPCIAGTKGKISRDVFTRASAVVAPAFSSVTQHIDFFKVPLRLLMSSWNDWKLNINDLNSSALSNMINGSQDLTISTSIPRMNFGGSGSTSNPSTFADRALSMFDNTFASTPSTDQRLRFLNDLNRLLQPLGYGSLPQFVADGSFSSWVTANYKNLFPIAAYQKVYYDHYRNSAYESNNNYAYNLDYLVSGLNNYAGNFEAVDPEMAAYLFKNMFTLRYANYRNDFQHNIYPGLNYTSSTPNGSSWQVPSSIQQLTFGNSSNILPNTGSQTSVAAKVVLPNSTSYGTLTVQNIRAAFALDKLLRASAYTPKHVREQMKARFGVDVGSKVSNESERICSFQNEIVFGEVTNTAASVDYELGTVGGKGVGSDSSSSVDFYCEEDSIILGVQYFLPRASYDVPFDEWNDKLTREDFFQPEFENLGLRPVYNDYINGGTSYSTRNLVVGYTTPNLRYKIGRDLNLGLFMQKRVNFFGSGSSDIKSSTVIGDLSSFAVHTDVTAGNGGSISTANANYFKVYPEALDSLFVSSYEENGDPSRDQFYGQLRINMPVVQGMSVHGQPSI